MQQPCRLLHRGLSHSGTKRRPVLCDPLGLRAPFSALHAPPLWVARPSPSAGASQTAAHFRRSQGLSQARPSAGSGREGGPDTHIHIHTHTHARAHTR